MNMKRFLMIAICLLCGQIAAAQGALEQGRQYYAWNDYKRALPYLQSAAKEGYGEACYLLGEMYYYGLGTETNHTIAARMYGRSTEFGYDKGEAELGRMYENGEGVGKDSVKAFELYRISAEKDIELGKYLLARSYFYAIGTECDYDAAYKILCSLNSPKTTDWIVQNVNILLGCCYKYGWGTSPDVWNAICCFEKSQNADYLYRAAILMDENGMGLYGNDRSSGVDYKRNKLFFLEKAIDAGVNDAEAYFKFAVWAEQEQYIKSRTSDPVRRGVYSFQKIERSKVFECLERSAEMNYGPAQKLLGDWYEQGKETPVNLVKAREWHAKAKANGYSEPEKQRQDVSESDGNDSDESASGKYRIGDKYKSPVSLVDLGIVVFVDGSGDHGLVMAFNEDELCSWTTATGKSAGGWRLPTRQELRQIQSNRAKFNKVDGSARIFSQLYWSSETEGSEAWCVSMVVGKESKWPKSSRNSVRYVLDF